MNGPASTAPELTALTQLARALSRPADLAESLDAALATVSDVLGLQTGWVWLLDEGSSEPRLAAARALPPALRDHPDAMRGDCHCLKTQRAGDLRGAANVNVVWCSRLERVLEDDEDATTLRCHASIPLSTGDRPLGMLNVASHDWRVLSEPELNLLTSAGALVSLVIERSRLEAASARAHAAREVHDTLAQSLAALTMQLEVADALAGTQDDPRIAQAIERALALSRATLEDARRSVLELREAPLGGLPFGDALQKLGDAYGAAVLIDELPALSAALQLGLYRIAQQALANAARHARASRVELRLTQRDDLVVLRVQDDGVGFDPSHVPADRFGLIGMNERARLLGGRLSVESEPDTGTAIEVEVPVT